MASQKKSVTKPFSRMKNDLAELQRWWPAYVKNDGIGGLSVSPTLFRSHFGPRTLEDDGGLNDESTTAGIRIEAINDDGTDATGAPTVIISGSGTLDAKCTITHADATTTIIRLVAPSGEMSNPTADLTLTRAEIGRVTTYDATTGPFPVLMTIQELVEMIDTYRHIGEADDIEKKSWIPHGLVGSGQSPLVGGSSAANPSLNQDPREPTSVFFPMLSPYRATVFMPMILDSNQLDKRIVGAKNDIAKHLDALADTGGYEDGVLAGITRYDAQPSGVDAATIRYKTVGYSGDHLLGHVGAWQAKNNLIATTHNTPDISPDSSACIGPKYRMKMALAMFLKDGTYAMSDGGSLIPYTYDPERTIGGENTSTMLAVWDGLNGKGAWDYSLSRQDRQCSAQFWPLYDFIQGPIAPAAQSSNFDFSVVGGESVKWFSLRTDAHNRAVAAGDNNVITAQPRMRMLRNNPIKMQVIAAERTGNVMSIWCNHSLFTSSTPANAFQPTMPFVLDGLDGGLGTGATAANSNWPAASDGLPFTSQRNHNGWWISNDFFADTFNKGDIVTGATGAFAGFRIKVRINSDQLSGGDVAAYLVSANTAFVSQGIQGGYEDGDNPYLIASLRSGDTTTGQRGTGVGFAAGIATPATSAFTQTGHEATYPARTTLGPKATPDSLTGVYSSGVKYTPRSIQIVSASDNRFALSPTIEARGGGVLRIPPALGMEYADRYYGVSDVGVTAAYAAKNDEQTLYENGFSVSSRWFSKGVSSGLWSFMENSTGKHSWDYIKPKLQSDANVDWTYGRNRPWPTHERAGTRLAYSPSLLSGATLATNQWTSSAPVGNRVAAGLETTKYGLSENGASAMWLDFELRGFIPSRSNRMVRIEFDTGANHPLWGRHSMLFDNPVENNQGRGYIPLYDESGVSQVRTGDTSSVIIPTSSYTNARSVVWLWGDANYFASGWNHTREWPFDAVSTNAAFGSIANGYGTGGGFAYSEGMNTIRTLFTEAGMTLLLNGQNKGTDANSNNPVWGFTVECADAGGASDGTTLDANGVALTVTGPNFSKSQADLQIDELTLRQIPSPAMLPFTVDTMTQTVSGESISKYTSLTIEADNVSLAKGMNITATIMTPSGVVPNAEGAAIVSGFENVDLSFAGGIGSMDLSALPSSVVTSGFVIRFNFYIPSSDDSEFHPIDWNAIPTIRSWTLEYDIAPTVALSVIGNTFNGDISAPINTKVGHIISFRGTGTTTDTDRKISEIKFDFGDGTSTAWLAFADQTLLSASYDTAHSYLASGTYAAVAYTKDDRGNESVASTSISVVVANAPPVAVLRAVPSLVRAGQPVTLDASGSYDINAGGTISAYLYNAGDGSGTVGGGASSVQHTYASGGEYQATLVVTDSDSTLSQTASVVIKVLPATLVVPLTLNTKPTAFTRTRSANLTQTPVLDAIYPEVTDMGQRTDEFVLTGSFLKDTANADISMMEELHLSGALVEIIYEEVNFQGTPTGKTFVGRMVSFDYQREGGKRGETPYTSTFIREAGLGV